jgi:pimeloyl-ACP methyl ester carboxylesterase
MFQEVDAQSPWDRKPNYGFRCVKLSSPPPPAASARIEPANRDSSKEKPVSDEVFQVFRRRYSYDKGPLDARVEETETNEDWTREKVSFNAAYGGERVIAHLYLPRNAAPPYQTVVYFPGSGAQHRDKFDTSAMWGNDFVPKCGRAFLFPIYKGTYERRDASGPHTGSSPTAWHRPPSVAWSNDLGRALDYLETRRDIDCTKLAYSGYSWGAHFAPVLLAADPRFKTAILAAAGLFFSASPPEDDRINYLPRLKIPTLMLNGRYDYIFPVETSQRPFFRLLGTPEKDKKHVIYEAGHIPPNREAIREILAWLDKYLGPVKK